VDACRLHYPAGCMTICGWEGEGMAEDGHSIGSSGQGECPVEEESDLRMPPPSYEEAVGIL
jgi:hypothetical protein